MPATVAKFRTNGDAETADLLENVIYKARAAGPPSRAPSALSCRAGLRVRARRLRGGRQLWAAGSGSAPRVFSVSCIGVMLGWAGRRSGARAPLRGCARCQVQGLPGEGAGARARVLF